MLETLPASILAVILFAGIALMLAGAHYLVEIVKFISQKYKLSPVFTGAILLGFGTSLPEIIISINAAFTTPKIAYGNAIGSNIANIGLILGVGLCLARVPLVLKAREVYYQLLLLGGSVVAFVFFAYDFVLTPVEAVLSFALFLFCLWYISSQRADTEASQMPEQEASVSYTPFKMWSIVAVSCAALGFGSDVTVSSAEKLAPLLGVSPKVIGLVLVAIGTSLPELLVTFKLARKGEHKMIVGNILGSNIFNLLLVLPIAFVAKPMLLNGQDVFRDGGYMFILSLLFVALCLPLSKLTLSWRWFGINAQALRQVHYKSGILLLLVYIVYIFPLLRQIFF